jgi:hypothetical protein
VSAEGGAQRAVASVVPSWAPRLPEPAVFLWCGVFASIGLGKFLFAVTSPASGDLPPIASLTPAAALFDVVLAAATACRRHRRAASLAAFALHVGLVGFAFIAAARGLPWRAGGRFFYGFDVPWLPWHALTAAALSLPFLAIFLDAERRAAGTR